MCSKYPSLEINLRHLNDNVKCVVKKCNEKGINVAGVIKGTTGLLPCVKEFENGGVSQIASSRMEQLIDVAEAGTDLPLMLIRIPMLSEVEDVIKYTDISLNSERKTLEKLNQVACEKGKVHKVVLMADLGDLREGFWDKDEFVETAEFVENDLDNLHLYGIGTNLGCYGSVLATEEKLDELAMLAEKVEKHIGRELECISGGATSSFMRVLDGDMPSKINHLRIGEQILLARDLDVFYGYDVSDMHQDVYTVKAEVIEVKTKPSHPVGEIAVDAFGQKQTYVDRGMRKRAILALGKVDIGGFDEIFPKEEGIEILGGSSDHTLLDVEDFNRELEVGDILSFGIDYASLVYLTSSRNVKIEYK